MDHDKRECCGCCGEHVGRDDAEKIREQLENKEKNCMWCGEDFNLTEEERQEVLYNDDDDFDYTVSVLNSTSARILNEIRVRVVDTNDFDYLFARGVEPPPKKETEEWKKDRKRAILQTFGIDIDKERFEPGYADNHGNPRDRMADGDPYEFVDVNGIAHRALAALKRNPNMNTTDLKRKSHLSRKSALKRIDQSPMARMAASGLIVFTSDFSGLYNHNTRTHASQYFGKIPRFKRIFNITTKGETVLKKLDSGTKRVYV